MDFPQGDEGKNAATEEKDKEGCFDGPVFSPKNRESSENKGDEGSKDVALYERNAFEHAIFFGAKEKYKNEEN